jgi:hypothetical protein
VKYTVILLRPDYVADVFGQDTYLAHVEASVSSDAVIRAQIEANEQDDGNNSLDYYPLAVFAGHLDDLSEG